MQAIVSAICAHAVHGLARFDGRSIAISPSTRGFTISQSPAHHHGGLNRSLPELVRDELSPIFVGR
jgi:hypothetical protein